MIRSSLRQSYRPKRSGGFALVIALSLMGFVLLLLLTFITITKVETGSSAQSQKMMEARQNAYLGVMVALGELQKKAGPDQRISARADVLTGSGGVAENAMVNPYWLGLWQSDLEDWDTLSAQDRLDAAFWLVSGNEGLEPGDVGYVTPLTEMDADAVTLMPELATYDVGAVRVPAVAITTPTGAAVGHYAYYASGENAKALVTLRDPYEDSTDYNELRHALIVPQKNGIAYLDDLGSFPTGDPKLERLIDMSSDFETWVDGADADTRELRLARAYDLTTWSKGLLTDTKYGGLKRDLTQLFEIDASFDTHFPEQTYGSETAYETAAKNPLTAHPYYFAEDSVFVSGAPNWAVLRDYYQHYRDTTAGQEDVHRVKSQAEEITASGSNNFKYLPYLAKNGFRQSSPFTRDVLPYQADADGSDAEYDGYQFTSWVTPIISQIRFSHALEIQPRTNPNENVLYLSLLPVFGISNPYNTGIELSDLGLSWQLNPRITLDFFYDDETTATVDFYQAEIYPEGNGADFTVKFDDTTLRPGQTNLQAFAGFTEAKDKKNAQGTGSAGESNNLRRDWTSVGRLGFPLNATYPNGNLFGPVASTDGAVSLADVIAAGVTPTSHPQWGLSTDERDAITKAVAERGKTAVEITISYEESGSLFLFRDSKVDDRVFQHTRDLWRPGASSLDTYSRYFEKLEGAAEQDSLQTVSFAMLTVDEDGDALESDAMRNLVDTNFRSIYSDFDWDGDSDSSVGPFLSTHLGAVIYSNSVSPQSNIDPYDIQQGFWGKGIDVNGALRVVLFDRPRSPVISIGQLQHANLGRYHFDPTYIVGNSYASLRIPLSDTSVNDFGGVGGLKLFDWSYLVNDQIWDGYFFSSLEIPYGSDDLDDLKATLADEALDTVMQNPRIEFIPSDEDRLLRYERIVNTDTGSAGFDTAAFRSASEMWVNGAFNVNSTSVEAWKAILSASADLKIPTFAERVNANTSVDESGVIYSRFSQHSLGAFDASDASSNSEFWGGYRKLSSAEISNLAEAIVEQVKTRGPFRSLADFVNRSLTNDESGKKGALQAALDVSGGVNDFGDEAIDGEPVQTFDDFDHLLSENLSATDRSNIGFAGYLLQGDLLQQLGPVMTVRSDTFKIRAYGDVVNPVTQEVESRVWCEVLVQRVPTPVAFTGDTVEDTDMPEFIVPSSEFGRQFKILSFSWSDEEAPI